MSTLTPDVRNALDLDLGSSAWERTIDITTTGARTGRPRRIEIWFHQVHGRWYLSSNPARRDWYHNLLANPRFTVHVKHGAHADLAATARPVADLEARRAVLGYIVDDLNQPHNPARLPQPQRLEDWMAGSPLLEIVFDDIAPAEATTDSRQRSRLSRTSAAATAAPTQRTRADRNPFRRRDS